VPFFVFALARTDSQAGYVAFAVVLLAALAFSGRARRQVAVGVLAFVLLSIGYYTFVRPPTAFTSITSEDNTGARKTLWTVGAHVVLDHPVIGVGAGSFVLTESEYATSNLPLRRVDQVQKGELVHNSYLQVATEVGLVGLLAFLAIVAGCVQAGARAARLFATVEDFEVELLVRGLVVGTIGMLVAYFFATNQYEKQLWLLLGLGSAAFGVARRVAFRESAERSGPRARAETP
jgi:O-antigen ligase